jgi:hypothetical protein
MRKAGIDTRIDLAGRTIHANRWLPWRRVSRG